MRITVGSQNINKIKAVESAVALYPDTFKDATVERVAVEIEEFGHPQSIEAVVAGATDRAKQAFGEDVSYSFGIESGLMQVPGSQTGFIEVQVCAIYNGERIATGLSNGFEWPTKVLELIRRGEADGSKAVRLVGITTEEKVGNVESGVIGLLTQGKVTRESQLYDAIVLAMIQIQRPELYE